MDPPNSQILSVSQMQAAEQALVDAGSSVDELMQIAGSGAAEWIWRVAAGRTVTVLCGPGNNGGDGYVIAETLRQRGLPVQVVAPLAPEAPAAKNARRDLKLAVASSGKGIGGEVLVDCLFGSGLSRPLSAELLLLLRDLAGRHPLRIAIDLPSGIASDDGAQLNANLPTYALTVALEAWKFAHWSISACARMGEKRLVSIGVDPVQGAAQLVGKPQLGAPDAAAHKYTRGLCAVVGGAMPGAALLSCQAAMRSGAGYVKLLAEQSHPDVPADLVVDESDLPDAVSDTRIASVLIGPGLGRGFDAKERLEAVLAREYPTVLDADALILLAPAMLGKDVSGIATPHEGELETMCKAFAVIASGKREKAAALAKASGLVIVAKGPGTVIASPDGRTVLSPQASSWLSIAGTGDVLAGIAASRLATGVGPFEAACEAVWLHSETARLAGPVFTATTLAETIPQAYAACL